MSSQHPDLKYPAVGLALLATAQFIIAVDYNIVYVALPSIGAELGFSARHLQWVISAYALAFGGFMLLGGRLGDIIGRRRAFIVAMLLYAAASLSGGLAQSSAVLILSRAVQGLGGALLFPTTLSMISTFFGEGAARNRALAVMGAAGASGGASGALLGGLITSGLGWNWTFFINVPVAGAAAIAALILLPRDQVRSTGAKVDVPGAIIGTAGVSLLVLACIDGPEIGWLSPKFIAMVTGSVALIFIFLGIERRAPAPLMPLRLLSHPTLAPAMLITGLFGAAFGAQYYLLTEYLQSVRHYAPSYAGLAFLPFALSIITGTRLGGQLVGWLGLRKALLTSLALGVGGQTLVALSLSADGSYLTHLLPGFLLDGVGQGATWTLMWIAATSGISAQDRGIASGMASSAQQVGAALGLALLVGVATGFTHGGGTNITAMISGLRAAFFAAAAIGVLAGCVVTFRIARFKPVEPTSSEPIHA